VPQTSLLIRNGLVVTSSTEARPADIYIEDGAIMRVEAGLASALSASAGERPIADRVIDAHGRLVVPGFVTSHYHSHDVLLRGSFEPMPLEAWFMVGVPANYPKRSREEIKARAMLGALECLRGGITTLQDMSTVFPFDEDHVAAILEAYDEIGIRAVFALQVADTPGQKGIPYWEEVVPAELQKLLTGSVRPIGVRQQIQDIVESQIAKWRGKHTRITWGLGPATPENCSDEFLERMAGLAQSLECRVYTHVYESKSMALNARRHYAAFGGSLIRYIEKIGLLNSRLTMAHCVWLQPEEIERIAQAGAHVALNPVSNLKTKSGVAPIREFLEAGVPVGLGTDNCSCSDAQNMFQSMKMFCLLAAASHGSEGRPTAADAVRAATEGSAAAVGLGGSVGRIAPGFRADLTLINLSDPAMQPLNDPIRQLVYSECGRAVETVIVDGAVVIDNGRSAKIDEQALFETVARLMPGLRRDLGAVLERNREITPYLRKAHQLTLREDVGINRFIATPGL
jgi:guanine deaminase